MAAGLDTATESTGARRGRSRLAPQMSETASPSAARDDVVAAALDLFARQGFEATSVDQIAQAAGISRSTFFRQFGGKDDVVFADHELLLDKLRTYLARPHENPWEAVCEASMQVYRHFAADPELARRRYTVVRDVPALRDREIVTVFRYERLFDEYLRTALPGLDPLDAVSFGPLSRPCTTMCCAASCAAPRRCRPRRCVRDPRRLPRTSSGSARAHRRRPTTSW